MKNKKNKKVAIFSILIFAVGLMIAINPLISRLYYDREASTHVSDFEESRANLLDEEILERISLAEGYNNTLDPSKLGDPYTEQEQKRGSRVCPYA